MSDKTEIKKAPEKAESKEKATKKSPEKITEKNTKAAEKLTTATKKTDTKKETPDTKTGKKTEKPKTGEKKKEKNWQIGLGTTDVSSDDQKMNVSTSGLKFENKKKSLEITVGAATITETTKPGAFPESKTLPGFSLRKRF